MTSSSVNIYWNDSVKKKVPFNYIIDRIGCYKRNTFPVETEKTYITLRNLDPSSFYYINVAISNNITVLTDKWLFESETFRTQNGGKWLSNACKLLGCCYTWINDNKFIDIFSLAINIFRNSWWAATKDLQFTISCLVFLLTLFCNSVNLAYPDSKHSIHINWSFNFHMKAFYFAFNQMFVNVVTEWYIT